MGRGDSCAQVSPYHGFDDSLHDFLHKPGRVHVDHPILKHARSVRVEQSGFKELDTSLFALLFSLKIHKSAYPRPDLAHGSHSYGPGSRDHWKTRDSTGGSRSDQNFVLLLLLRNLFGGEKRESSFLLAK